MGLEWYVYKYDDIKDEVISWNIFANEEFEDEVVKLLLGARTFLDITNGLDKILMKHFRNKSDCIVYVKGKPYSGSLTIAIDVYDQIKDNWAAFISYIWAMYYSMFKGQ